MSMQRMKVYSAGLWIWLLLCCSNSLMVMSVPWQLQRMRPVGVMVPLLYSLAVMPLERFLCVLLGGGTVKAVVGKCCWNKLGVHSLHYQS
jgi:hypothetical protein